MSHQAPVQFRPASAETWQDPWPMYRALRDHDPVHHILPEDGTSESSSDRYVLSRHADIWSAAGDHETFSSSLAAAVKYGELKLLEPWDNSATPAPDSPEAEFRKLIARGFTPRQVEAFEPAVHGFVVERIEELRTNGGGDIVAELFWPLPCMVVAHYLGVPKEDHSHFAGWTKEIVAANLAESAEGLQSVVGAFTTMMGYFTELIKLRRRIPGDDTISQLVTTGMGGDGDIVGVLSLLAFVFAMVASGIDTTTGMLGGSAQLLHQRPDQRRLLIENPEYIPASLDEFLRLTSPVQLKTRIVTRDVTIRDTAIPAGSQVLFLYGSANRDERQYGPDAGALDVRRQPRNILTFSHGANHCLGAALARMQSRIVLTELLARCPDFEVDESDIVWADSTHVRRPVSVPFRV